MTVITIHPKSKRETSLFKDLARMLNTPYEIKKGKADILSKNSSGDSVFAEFSGIWSKDEAGEIAKIIEDTCENINPDDWK